MTQTSSHHRHVLAGHQQPQEHILHLFRKNNGILYLSVPFSCVTCHCNCVRRFLNSSLSISAAMLLRLMKNIPDRTRLYYVLIARANYRVPRFPVKQWLSTRLNATAVTSHDLAVLPDHGMAAQKLAPHQSRFAQSSATKGEGRGLRSCRRNAGRDGGFSFSRKMRRFDGDLVPDYRPRPLLQVQGRVAFSSCHWGYNKTSGLFAEIEDIGSSRLALGLWSWCESFWDCVGKYVVLLMKMKFDEWWFFVCWIWGLDSTVKSIVMMVICLFDNIYESY